MNPGQQENEPTTPVAAAEQLRATLVEGRYEKTEQLREIGRGGMGRVLAGMERGLQREVAMKFLQPGMESALQDRFVREARITGQLEHPSIVPVHDIAIDDAGRLFYTMKRVRGNSLREVIGLLQKNASNPGAPVPDFVAELASLSGRLTVFQKICDAVAFAHAHPLRVIHRDLKPANVMVGEYGEVLVMDWGLAKVLGPSGAGDDYHDDTASGIAGVAEPGLTLSGQAHGTLLYAPPEQLAGRVDLIDERSDVYALGGILYELLSLQPPLQLMASGPAAGCAVPSPSPGSALETVPDPAPHSVEPTKADEPPAAPATSAEAVLQLINSSQTAPLLRHSRVSQPGGATIPKPLAPVILRALQPRREDRFQSVAELQNEIRLFQNGFATLAEQAGAWAHFKYFIGRHRGVSAATAASILLVSGLTAGFSWNLKQERDTSIRERDAKIQALARLETEYARAESEKRRAVATRNEAEELVRFLLVDLGKKLEDKASLKVLGMIEARVDAYYSKLGFDKSDGSQVFLRSQGYFDQAGARQALGNAKGALACYHKCRDLLALLWARTPGDPVLLSALSAAESAIGSVHLELLNFEAAGESLDRDLILTKQLLEREPDNAELRWKLSISHFNRGRLWEDVGDLAMARRSLEDCQAIRQPLAGQDAERLFDLAEGHRTLARLLFPLEGPATAAVEEEKAIALLLDLTKRDAQNTRWQNALMETYREGAGRHRGAGELDTAEELLAKARELLRQLLAKDADNHYWKQGECRILDEEAALAGAKGNVPAQVQCLAARLALTEKLLEKAPGDRRELTYLALTSHQLAGLHLTQQDPKAAKPYYKESNRYLEELIKLDPDNHDWKDRVCLNLNGLGRIALSEGDSGEAMNLFQEGIARRESLLKAHPNLTAVRRGLSASHQMAGGLHLAEGRKEDALTAYVQSRKHLEELLASANKTDEADYLVGLTVACGNAGSILLDKHRHEEAAEAITKAVEACKRLLDLQPENGRHRAALEQYQKLLEQARSGSGSGG